LPGGEAFEIVGPQGDDAVAHRRDVRLAGSGKHEGAGGRGDMKRVTVVTDDTKAELAEHGHLVNGHVGEFERERWLGDASPRLPDGRLIAGSAQDDDAFRHRLVGYHSKAFRWPGGPPPLE
jgi:hypothetical protein